MIGLWQDLSELLQREVDLSTEKDLKWWVKPNALKDAVSL
jgi:predicted nucleotidyltransferase